MELDQEQIRKWIGKGLKEAREKKGLSQEQLAAASAIAAPSISNYERGESFPSLYNLIRMQEVLGFSFDTVLLGDGELFLSNDVEKRASLTFSCLYMLLQQPNAFEATTVTQDGKKIDAILIKDSSFVELFKTWNHFKELAAVLSAEEIDAGMKKTMKKGSIEYAKKLKKLG